MTSTLSFVPKTVGECLDNRKSIEKKLNALLSSTSPLLLWKEGQQQFQPADSQVQSIIDRYQALNDLSEFINAVTLTKQSGLSVPKFIENVDKVDLTLFQLKELNENVICYYKQILDLAISQAESVRKESQFHDEKIKQQLNKDLEKNKQDHEKKKKDAKDFGEELPDSSLLEQMQETLRTRAKTSMAILVDPVGIKDFVTNLRSFVTQIETLANTKIDSVNSTKICNDIVAFRELREKAKKRMESCVELEDPIQSENTEVLSLAELTIAIKTTEQKILSAISKLCFVSYKKGQGKDIENQQVQYAKERLQDLLFNLAVLLEYKQKHKEGMCLYFTTTHPLSGLPTTVDSLVRFGFLEESKAKTIKSKPVVSSRGRGRGNSARGRGGLIFEREENENAWDETVETVEKNKKCPTLVECLNKLLKNLNSVEESLEKERKENEKEIQESISQKQDGRTKNSTALKSSDLEDIAKSVRATITKTWSKAENIDKATTRVTKLLDQVTEMQSSSRKSANSMIKLLVPKQREMQWSDRFSSLDGW